MLGDIFYYIMTWISTGKSSKHKTYEGESLYQVSQTMQENNS